MFISSPELISVSFLSMVNLASRPYVELCRIPEEVSALWAEVASLWKKEAPLTSHTVTEEDMRKLVRKKRKGASAAMRTDEPLLWL